MFTTLQRLERFWLPRYLLQHVMGTTAFGWPGNRGRFTLLGLAVLFTLGIAVNLPLWAYHPGKEDIYYTWLEGRRLNAGENPYTRVLASDMRTNDKYATYFPGFYLLSAGVQALGLREFDAWLLFWRAVFLVCNLAIAALLLLTSVRRGLPWLGLCLCVFWLCNRWTLYTTRVSHLDLLALLPLLLSLVLLTTRRRTSLVLFGVSLAIKQVAIFVLPVYLLWNWRSDDRNRWQRSAATLAWIALVPLVVSLPFLFWDFEGFWRSILFSATRSAENHVPGLHSLDTFVAMKVPWFGGLAARLPMLGAMALVWWATFRREVGPYTGSLLAFLVFLGFNSVLFSQYFVWPLALLPLALLERAERRGTES